MSITLQKIKTAWQQATKEEWSRIEHPPNLTIHQGGTILARNLKVLEHFIDVKGKISVTLPNRLSASISPSARDASKYDLQVSGNFRDYTQESAFGVGGTSVTVDAGPSKLSRFFERQVLHPIAQEVGCDYSEARAYRDHFILPALTSDQAATVIRQVHTFDAAPHEVLTPSYPKIIIGTLNHLRQ